MLDAIKGLTGGGKAQKQTDDRQGVIAAAGEERSALSTMITPISMRSATLARVDALKRERATLEEFRNQLRAAQGEIKHSVDHANALRTELDQVRGSAGQLAQDY